MGAKKKKKRYLGQDNLVLVLKSVSYCGPFRKWHFCGLRWEFSFCLGPSFSWGHLVQGLSRGPSPGSQKKKGPAPIGRHPALCSPKPSECEGGLLNDSILHELLETGPGVVFSLPLSPLSPLNHSTEMVVSISGEEPWAWPSAGPRV